MSADSPRVGRPVASAAPTEPIPTESTPTELTPRQLRRRLLALAKPIIAPLGMSILFRTAALIAGIAMLALAGWAVTTGFVLTIDKGLADFVSEPAIDPGPVLITLAVLALVKGLARYLEQYCGHYVAFRVLARIRLYFYDQLAPQAPAAVEGRDTGDLLSRVTKDVDRVEVFFAHTIAPAITALIVPVGTVAYAAVALGPAAASVLAVGLALVGLATPALGRKAAAQGAAQVRESRGLLAGHVRDSVQGVREVLAFDYQQRRLDELGTAARGLDAGLRALGESNAMRRGLNVVIIGLTVIAQLAATEAADLSMAQTGLALALTVAAFTPVLAVEDFAADLQQAYASARRIFEVTDAAPLVTDPASSPDAGRPYRPATVRVDGSAPLEPTPAGASKPRSASSLRHAPSVRPAPEQTPEPEPAFAPGLTPAPDGAPAPGPVPGPTSARGPTPTAAHKGPSARLTSPEVRFEQVGFRYPNASRSSPALADVTLTAAPGRVSGIVGASGSGKSTLAALLTRSWDPQAGTILLGGNPLREHPLDQLRAEVSVATQRPYLFNLSIEENLRLARPEATAEELERAASAACLDAVVAQREAGWSAPVGEMGELLSGGERQRLALARALLRDPAVLVLDEATSQLDPAVEAEVLRRLERAWRGKTVIVIAHRLSTVKNADRVYVMDGGRVVQQGGYAELAAAPGPFADLLAREDH